MEVIFKAYRYFKDEARMFNGYKRRKPPFGSFLLLFVVLIIETFYKAICFSVSIFRMLIKP